MKQKMRIIAFAVLMVFILAIMGACSDKEKAGDELDSVTEEQDGTEEDGTEVILEETEEKVVVPVQEVPLVMGGIKGVYESYGLKAGTCISPMVITQEVFTDHIIENYNSVTMENEMKPDAILDHTKSVAAKDLVVEFPQRTIDLLEWAKNNNMAVRGHVLVWYSQTPQWIFYKDFDTNKELVDRDTMLARMDSYIKQTFEQLETLGYLDMFYAYDIVNEAILDDGSLRDCLWKEIIGDDYIWQAFYYADKYAPESVKLFYNDFNEQFKTDAMVALANSLVDEEGRSLIDGIGCQAHLYTKDSIFDYMKTLKAFSSTGLDVQITEIDISLGTWQNILPAVEDNLKEQGQYYYNLVNLIVEGNEAGTTNVSGITFWGITDGVSWRKERSPLLFDRSIKPKYAYFGAILDKDHAGF